MNQHPLPRCAGACFTAMLLTAITQAGELATHGPQTGHVHGSAQLNLVREGGTVHIELISPAVNLVGFEHAPASETEHAARQSALATLEDTEHLFRFDGHLGCHATHTEVMPGSALSAQPTGPDMHQHPETGADEHADAQHADIVATYRYACDAPDGPMTLHVGLFEAFPAIEGLDVQYITDHQQGGTTLNGSEPLLTF